MSKSLKSKLLPQMDNKIRLGITDDHAIFREGLISLLEECKEFDVIFEAGNGIEALESLKSNKIDVMLLDIEMPRMDGVVTTVEIRKKFPNVKILILSMHNEEEFILHLIEKGANGFLLKETNFDTIIDAIHSVHNTGYYFNDSISRSMLKKITQKKEVRDNIIASSEVLNDRDKEIIRLICNEKSKEEIAIILEISIRTLERIRYEILKKIGAKNDAGIVLYAVKARLV